METVTCPDSGHQASLRQRKKEATRRALRSAATRLIAERGLAEVTVEDIAAGADVSGRTFFNYFASKEDAVVGWDPELVAGLAEALVARPAGEDTLEALSAVLVETLGGFETEPRDLLDRLSLIRAEPHLLACHVAVWAEVERRLVAALAARSGPVRPGAAGPGPAFVGAARSGEVWPEDRPPDADRLALVVAAALTACRVAVMTWCERDGQVPLSDLVRSNLRAVADGLAGAVSTTQSIPTQGPTQGATR